MKKILFQKQLKMVLISPPQKNLEVEDWNNEKKLDQIDLNSIKENLESYYKCIEKHVKAKMTTAFETELVISTSNSSLLMPLILSATSLN